MANHLISDMMMQSLFSWVSHLNWFEPDDSSPGDGGSGGEAEVYSVLFPTFDVIFILLADYGKNPSRGLKKKSSLWLKFQGAGVAPPPLQLWESVWAAAQPSHTQLETPPAQLAPAFIHDLH